MEIKLAIVKKVKPLEEDEKKRVELVQPAIMQGRPLMLAGQVFLAFIEGPNVLQPMQARANADTNDIVLIPLVSRWFCDACSACRTELLGILDRAKNPRASNA